MQKKDFRERRLFERLSCSLVGEYISADSVSGTFICKDLSPRGMGILVSDQFSVGTHLNMQIPTKKQTPLSLDGKVRWCKKICQTYRMGIEFSQPLFTPVNMII
jgi:hypothetical protein